MEPDIKTFGRIKITPGSCSQEETAEHFRAFADSFIRKNDQGRCWDVLIERPDKAKDELPKLENPLDERYCKAIDGVGEFLEGRVISTSGIYFDGYGSAFRVTAAEADVLSTWQIRDAVFSITPGKLAILFTHGGWRWGCSR